MATSPAMRRQRTRRLIAITFATAVAVVILLVVTLIAPTEHEAKQREVRIDTSITWDTDHSDNTDPEVPDQSGAFVTDLETDKGVFYQFFGQRLEPQPNGVTRVFRPMARIHLERHKRVIEIRADDATLVAPERQPRSGHFMGNVVLRLLEAPPDEPISYGPDSLHTVFKVFLDEAVFDLELGEIASADPIFITSRQVDFQGTGLIINYNEVDRRIERLVIARGKYMVISRGISRSAKLVKGDDPADTQEAAEPIIDVDAPIEPKDKPQYYRATFNKNVTVASEDSRIDNCDKLHVYFGIDSQFSGDNLLDDADTGAAPEPAQSMKPTPLYMAATASPQASAVALAQVATLAMAQAAPAPLTPPDLTAEVKALAEKLGETSDAPPPPSSAIKRDARSMLLSGSDDVVVNWTGPLSVVPIIDPPASMQGNHDVTFAFEGKPLRIMPGGGNLIIRTPTLEYAHNAGFMELVGSSDLPVSFDTEQWGMLTVPKVTVVPQESRVYLVGKGRWKAHGEQQVGASVRPQWEVEGQYDRLPPGSQLDWRDRVVLDLYTDTESNKTPTLGDLTAVKLATFHGDVNVTHPAFDMRGDRLVVGLSPPAPAPGSVPGSAPGSVPESGDEDGVAVAGNSGSDDPGAGSIGNQKINDLHAEGNVHVVSHSDDPQMQLSLRGDRLDLGLDTASDGRIRPTGLLVRGNVKVRREDVSLQAGDLEITLLESAYEPVKEDDGADVFISKPADGVAESTTDSSDRKRQKLEIKTVTAKDKVRVRLEEQGIQVYADRMLVEGEQIEFFGQNQSLPARILNDEGMLTAGHFVLNDKSQTLYALGPGAFDVFAREAEDDAAGEEEMLMVATWRERMYFKNNSNFAHFLGDVLVRAKRGDATTQLQSEDLKIDFVAVEQDEAFTAAASAPQQNLQQHMTRGNRALHMITARDNVRFEAANWGPTLQDLPLTRVSIQGDFMTFDRPSEQVQVHSAGRMGIEDYRPKKTDLDAPDPSTDSLVNVSGRGATIFTWNGQCILDFFHNDLRLNDQVQMYHLPLGAGPEKGMQLDCQQFVADLEENGGLGMITQSNNPQPNLKAIRATDNVRMIGSNKEIYTDKLDYTHANQTVVLSSTRRGARTQIIDNETGARGEAEQFRWDLLRNRIEMIEPGRNVAPIRR